MVQEAGEEDRIVSSEKRRLKVEEFRRTGITSVRVCPTVSLQGIIEI